MKQIACLLLVFLVALAVCVPTAEAAANMTFVTTNVYWEGPYEVAVEGYFKNTGTKIITGITYFELSVYASRGGEYIYLGKGIWNDSAKLSSLELYPGETSSWTFTVHTDRYINFQRWDVKSYYEYNYLR